MNKVIDVSYAQGNNIDWKKVKSFGVVGAVIRIGYGRETNQKDSCFETNFKNATAAGVPVLPYHYSYATDEAGARKEAACFLAWAENHKFARKIVFYDVEEKNQYNLTQAKIRAILNAYADEMQKHGWEVIVYSYKYFLDKIGASWLDANYRVWVAQYASKLGYSGKKIMWQYSSSGKVDGISGNVDMNECYDLTIFKGVDEMAEKKLVNPYPKKSTVQTVSVKEYGKDYKLTEHFTLGEFQCKNGADSVKIDWYVVNELEAARVFFNKPITISSAYRTAAYNASVGGASGSLHTTGRAVDHYMRDLSYTLLAKFHEAHGFLGVGCYYDDEFCHVDSRTSKFLWKNQSSTAVSTHLKTVRSGNSGQDVKDLQWLLNKHGASLKVDGVFGSGTKAAVKAFQKKKKLTADCIVGKKTWAALLNK